MKLKKILPYLDKDVKCRVFLAEDDDEPCFEGWVCDVPWTAAELKLFGEEAISMYHDIKNNKNYLIIYITGEE